MAVLVLDEDSVLQVVVCPDSYADQPYRAVLEVPEATAAWVKRVEREWNEVQEYLTEQMQDYYDRRQAEREANK
jgi:hypothetical protein